MSKIKMEMPEKAVVDAPTENNKMSYDELSNIANRLSAANNELMKRLNDVQLANFFNRLDFLFKVVKYSDKFPEDFAKKCIDEICDLMTLENEDTDK